jgi:preprotein translocase subunit SecG
MLTFLLVVQAIVAVLLVGVILMQQSEGGGLGMGGSPTGLMSARGAADFLTRATTILATLFIGLSILHAVLATRTGAGVSTIDTSLARPQAPVAPPPTTQPTVPVAGQPTAAVPTVPLANAPAPTAVPMTTAKPKVETAPVRTPRAAARNEAAPTAAPPPVTTTVTPSIPKATPAPAPSTSQGPPANAN